MICAVTLAKDQTASLSTEDPNTTGSANYSGRADALQPRPTVFLCTQIKAVSLSCYLTNDLKCFSKILFVMPQKSKEAQTAKPFHRGKK